MHVIGLVRCTIHVFLFSVRRKAEEKARKQAECNLADSESKLKEAEQKLKEAEKNLEHQRRDTLCANGEA